MIPRLRTGWIAPCLLAFAGCSQTVEVADSPPPPRPPATLLRPTAHPDVDATTHRGLVRGLLDYTAALDSCNASLGGVRAFYEALDREAEE